MCYKVLIRISIDLKSSIKQIYLVKIYSILSPTTAEATFFSCAHEIFTRIEHVLCPEKTNKIFKFPNTQNIFSGHTGMK